MSYVHWNIEFEVKDLRGLKSIMEELVLASKNEPGTVLYQWALSADKKTAHFMERFEDSEAALAHLKGFGPYSERFLATVQPMRMVVFGNPSQAVREGISAFEPVYMEGAGGFAR